MARNGVAKNGIVYLYLIILSVIALIPLVWLVSMSFKPQVEWFITPPRWIPADPTPANYIQAFTGIRGSVGGFYAEATTQSVVKPMINSLVIAGSTTVLATLIGYMAAYGISRYKAGGPPLMFLTLLTRMLPPIAITIPVLVFYIGIGLSDTHVGLTIAYLVIGVVFVVWMLKGFIDEIPREIEEAAMLDGASHTHVVFRTVMPLVRGGLAGAALLVFIFSWGEFLIALVLTGSEAFTIPVQIIKFQSVGGAQLGPMAALSTIALIPVLAIAYYIQKHLARGFTFGAVKGRQ